VKLLDPLHENIFRTTTASSAKSNDVNTTYTMKVTLEELYSGNRRYLQIIDRAKCLLCKYIVIIHGNKANSNCKRCMGSGAHTRKRLLAVNIRRGMINGDKIIYEDVAIRKKGAKRCGKLIVKLYEQVHPIYRRNGNNLYMTSLKQEKGRRFHNIIKTIDGRRIKITNTDGELKQDVILGEGIPIYGRKPKGALIVNYM